MTARIHALQKMTTAQLREEWRRVMGEEPRSYHRTWLWRRLAWAIQAKEYGGLSERARRRIDDLTPEAEAWMPLGKRAFKDFGSVQTSKPQETAFPSPGTVVTRKYRGRTLAVTVLDDGFEFEDQRYESLSAIVKAVTRGSHQSGPRFFGVKGKEGAR